MKVSDLQIGDKVEVYTLVAKRMDSRNYTMNKAHKYEKHEGIIVSIQDSSITIWNGSYNYTINRTELKTNETIIRRIEMAKKIPIDTSELLELCKKHGTGRMACDAIAKLTGLSPKQVSNLIIHRNIANLLKDESLMQKEVDSLIDEIFPDEYEGLNPNLNLIVNGPSPHENDLKEKVSNFVDKVVEKAEETKDFLTKLNHDGLFVDSVKVDLKSFETGAVRIRPKGRGRYDLLSPVAIKRIAKRCEVGEVNYGDGRNWEKGMPTNEFIDSALRHIFQYLDGDNTEDHLAAAAWNLSALMHTEDKKPEMQNIPSRKEKAT
jgi:DNA-binding transcriptional regulator YhcF (GntR family)